MRADLTLLTFVLDSVLYAIDVRRVQEVVSLPELIPLADGPASIRGLFNLRGRMVTTIDLRQRLGLERRPWDLKNAVLIVPFQEKLYGMLVDEAVSLVDLAPAELEPAPPATTPNGQARLISGIGKTDGRLVPILEPEGILMSLPAEKRPEAAQEQEEEIRIPGGRLDRNG